MGSTRASAWSCGTDRARWIRSSGAIANGTSHGFAVQNAASTTPSAAKTNSVDSVWYEKSRRIGCPLTKRIIGAISEELSATSTTEAAVPASAKRTSSLGISLSAPMIACALPQAPIVAIVNTQMLVACTYQVPRLRSHSGTCWISGISATSARRQQQHGGDQEDAGRVVGLVSRRAHDEELRKRDAGGEDREFEPVAGVPVDLGDERRCNCDRPGDDTKEVQEGPGRQLVARLARRTSALNRILEWDRVHHAASHVRFMLLVSFDAAKSKP